MCCSFFPLTWGSRTVKAGIDSSAEGRCGYANGLELLGQLRQPAFQEPSLGLLAGEGERALVGHARLGAPAKSPAQIGARRVRQVIVAKLAAGEDPVDQRETAFRAVAHRHCDGPGE